MFQRALSSLKRLFAPRPEAAPADKLEFADRLDWIPAGDNPWGVDIIDCRPVTMSWRSTTSDASVAESFMRLRGAEGLAHVQAGPLPHAIEGGFELDVIKAPPEGCLYRATEMEDKWDMYYWSGNLYVSRSWTGTLCYTARMECDGSKTTVSEIRSNEGENVDFRRRELHFLLTSHAIHMPMPHPLPEEMPDREQRAAKALIGSHTFSQYGRFGWFGTFADTIGLRSVPFPELKAWVESHPPKLS